MTALIWLSLGTSGGPDFGLSLWNDFFFGFGFGGFELYARTPKPKNKWRVVGNKVMSHQFFIKLEELVD